MDKRPLKVFLCHASADKPKVRELYRTLKRRGVQPWLDAEDLIPGQNWEVEIPKALLSSDAIIICLTPNSVDKEGYVQKEIKFALDKAMEMPEGRIFIIPARLEECDLPFSLRQYQAVNLYEKAGYTKLMRALKLRASQLERSTVQLPKTGETTAEIKKVVEEKKSPEPKEEKPETKTPKPTVEKIGVGGDVKDSVIVSGSGNVINIGEQKKSEPEKPQPKKANTSRKPNTAVIVAIIGLVGTLCAALISSPLLANVFDLPSTPTSPSPLVSPSSDLPTPGSEQGKFKLAMVLIGLHDDGGFSQTHFEGLRYVADNVPNVEVTYKENIPEGVASEQVFRDLANEGYSLILGTSFGYMDSMEKVASEFPNVIFLNINGVKTNGMNFGNVYGAMEDMSYLAGMLAGARAKQDGNPKLGYMATFPIPEELRIGNAIALGMRKTCPECSMDVRWLNTWNDPAIEQEAALSLFNDGAQIVFSGTSTSIVIDMAQAESKWGVTRDWYGLCNVKSCLTSTYWNWGQIYAKITNDVIAGTYKPGSDYFDADSGALGIYGLMSDQEMTDGMKNLPPEVIAEVRTILSQMLVGEFTRFDVFSGPIYDNKGSLIVPVGERLEQVDLDAFPGFGLNCKYCMNWWAEGITADLP